MHQYNRLRQHAAVKFRIKMMSIQIFYAIIQERGEGKRRGAASPAPCVNKYECCFIVVLVDSFSLPETEANFNPSLDASYVCKALKCAECLSLVLLCPNFVADTFRQLDLRP